MTCRKVGNACKIIPSTVSVWTKLTQLSECSVQDGTTTISLEKIHSVHCDDNQCRNNKVKNVTSPKLPAIECDQSLGKQYCDDDKQEPDLVIEE